MKKLLLLSTLSLLSLFMPIQDTFARKVAKGKSVIMIGFDGLSSSCLNNGADMPTLRRLIAEGSSSLEVRSVLPSSSAVNWASVFMGSGPELHGYTNWGSKTPDLPSREYTANGMYPDIYWALKQKYPDAKTAYFYEWGGMRYLADTLSIDYIQQLELSGSDSDNVLQPMIEYIVDERPTFSSIIFGQPDGAGHKYGWSSTEYLDMVNTLDKSLKRIVDAVEKAGMMENTMIVITSDHGGIKTGHGGKTMDEMQVPVVYYGAGVKRGYIIDKSLMIYDVTATIGQYLNIDQPEIWLSRPVQSIFK